MKILKGKNLKDAQMLMNKHKSQKPEKLVVKYYMDGCGACEDLEPKWQKVIQKLSKDIPSSIMIAEVESNAQKHLPIPNKMGFPTVSIMNVDSNGSFREEDEHIGSMPEDKLMEILTKAISSQAGGKRRKKTHKKKTRKHKRVKRRKSRKSKRRSKQKRR